MPTRIVVLGAGVSGLTSALLLARNKENKVTVVAKHMPGDYDIEYTSPWAGANVLPMSVASGSRWERRTWPELKRLAEQVPDAGIHFQKARVYRRNKDAEGEQCSVYPDPLFQPTPWFRDLFPDYRELPPHEVPAGYDSGCEFTSVCVNIQVYLPWLASQCLKEGVAFTRACATHISDASSLGHAGQKADVVVNATGLGAGKLGGVRDGNVVPARGQIVLVRNSAPHMVATSGTDDERTDVCYVMTRAAGGGTVLGGTYHVGNWDAIPREDVAERIMRRAVEIVPELVKPGQGVEGLDVVRHGVGLRPVRHGGVRLERENVEDEEGRKIVVVHNYGHGGWGYQGSYGCAERVVELVEEVKRGKAFQSKL